MAVNTTPKNSWVVYSDGERNQFMHPLYRLRSRYIKTKDPLPVMHYKKLEKAIPSKYDLPLGEEITADTESQPELFEEETPPVEELPQLGEELMADTEGLPELLEEETLSVEESSPLEQESDDHIRLASATGSVGDEISVEADRGLLKITEVYVNGIQADFLCIDDTNLIFVIPEGATSGTVELVGSSGDINAGALEVVFG